MSDARSILRLYDHARANGFSVVLATVLRTFGSTYRKAGARMMLCADGSRVGVVSGGCLEGDVTRRAWFLKAVNEAELIRYDTGSGDDATYEFGLGCRGVVDVLIERLDLVNEPNVIRMLRESVAERASQTLRIDLSSIPMAGGESIETPSGDYVEEIRPPTQLLIFGSGADVPPLVHFARELGWSIIVVDHKLPRSMVDAGVNYLSSAAGEWTRQVNVDGQTACVFMTHRMKDDAAYLADALLTTSSFLGCLGPATRTEALIDELALAGVILSDSDRQRIRAPVGLDLGAERPQEIALAIIAEVAASMSGTSGGPLCAREGPIHGIAPTRQDLTRPSRTATPQT